jgi:hypothetical protein
MIIATALKARMFVNVIWEIVKIPGKSRLGIGQK